MNFEDVLFSGEVSADILEKAQNSLLPNEKPVFAVAGDLTLQAKYGTSALVVTNSRLLCYDGGGDGYFIDINKITEISVKRQYGNALLIINGKRVLRFSFCAVAAMEAAADYVKAINDGADYDALQIIKNTIDKQNSFCPKCGRSLLHSGAECINCLSKKKLVKRLWVYVRPQRWRLLVCILLSAVTTATSLVPPYVTKMLVDDVIPKGNIRLLFALVLLLVTVHLSTSVIGAVRTIVMRRAGDRMVTNLRNDVYEKAQYLTVNFYDKTGTGSMYSRISGDTSVLNNFMLRISQEAVVQFFLMVGIVVIMFTLNWKLALLSLLPIPLVAIGTRLFRLKIRPIYHKKWIRWSQMCNVISDSLPGIRVIKAFTGEQTSVDKFHKVNDAWYEQSQKVAFWNGIFPNTVGFLATCGSLIIWAVGGTWAIHSPEVMSVGLLVSFISYASMFYNPVNFFANLSDSYSDALNSTERLLDVLDAETENDRQDGLKVDKFDGKIEFCNVSFSFDKTVKVLDNINLTIEPGDIVGIVGTTGAGKTTLINLLMRYYRSYEGDIFVDGKNIKDIDLESYRRQIGFVQQEPLMFHDTIYSNIALSDPNTTVERVIEAAEVANAHGFITRLPDAYDTVLGERGIGVSGGEKQRLSIARAVIKNPSVLIFDEATASVDSETEHLIQEAIERLISGRTTIMIAHRLSTLRRANKIVVIDKGKVAEFGSHEELMALKGKYYKLVEIQNLSEEIRQKTSKENFEGEI